MAQEDDLPDFAIQPIDEAATVAPAPELHKLHGTLARAMMTRLRTGSATSSEWNAIAKFLADNAIDSKAAGNEKLDALRDRLKAKQKEAKMGIPQSYLDAAEKRMGE